MATTQSQDAVLKVVLPGKALEFLGDLNAHMDNYGDLEESGWD